MNFVLKLITNTNAVTINFQDVARNVAITVQSRSNQSVNAVQPSGKPLNSNININDQSVNAVQPSCEPLNSNINMNDQSVNTVQPSCEPLNSNINMNDQSVNAVQPSCELLNTGSLKNNKSALDQACCSKKKSTEPKMLERDSKECSGSKKRSNLDEDDDRQLRKRANLMLAEEKIEHTKTADKLECSVCLQTCVLPVQLSCSHIFCYLCVKGLAQNNDLRCALCRQEIPQNFLQKPHLLSSAMAFQGINQWFYQGQNGWWQYDDRTSVEIETAYQKGESKCELMIAGVEYIVDLQENRQYRKDNVGRRRRIKRDVVSVNKKGVAGINENML